MTDISLRRIDKRRDIQYLTLLSTIGARYGYKLEADPDRRKPMPLAMLDELGYTAAVAEFRKPR